MLVVITVNPHFEEKVLYFKSMNQQFNGIAAQKKKSKFSRGRGFFDIPSSIYRVLFRYYINIKSKFLS